MTTITSVAAWRRVLLLTIVALVAALAITVGAPPKEAHAIRNPTVVLASHTGWVYVRQAPRACPAIYPQPAYCSTPSSVAVWRWTGRTWTQAWVSEGAQVYAYPYASGWHWIWTSRTGWLAIQTSQLETGYRCSGAACPVF